MNFSNDSNAINFLIGLRIPKARKIKIKGIPFSLRINASNNSILILPEPHLFSKYDRIYT